MTGNLLSRARRIAAPFGVPILPIHPAFAETAAAKLPPGITATAGLLSNTTNANGKTLDQLGKIKVPAEAIPGAADASIESIRPGKIRTRGKPVTIIGNAGHLFDGAQGFDLADEAESILKTLPSGIK